MQLLLSLSPELEKPILLLTYKNHALDEFLKHMLEFCQPNDLVRIGGRSKEPKLESCNLHSIMRSLTKSNINKSNESKAVFTEIEETKNEIEKVETKIKEVALMVEASSQLEKKSFVQELTEEQLQLFLVEANWGQPPLAYKLNSKTFANKTSIRQFVTNIFQKHDSLQEFLMKAIELGVSNKTSNEGRCFDVFSTVLREWFPDRQHLQQLKEIQTEFVLNLQSKTLSGYVIPDSDDECPDDSGDEGYVKELAETRMISGIKQEKNPKNSLVIFSSIKSNPNDVLIEISDYPKEMTVNSQIRNVKNLWELTKPQRLQFLYSILRDRASSVSQELDGLIEQLRGLKNRKEELEMNYKVEQLSQKKIIGVTITGASINHDLICHIGPSVVIVEEAAEILEPSLLAALTPSTEHLILIGDHQQLRPQVNAYDLREEFDFDVSMMERLIKSKFEYKTLTTQNRMRPEFSTLLKDIYPNLKDNMPLVSMNEPLKCVGKSMFFWSHEYPEEKDRSYTNVKEAERIRVLVVYLLCSGCRPNEITVLSAYKGQTNLLRKMLKEVKTKMPQLFKDTDPGEFVHVQTIDMYQGDENKYVLISLVRSNKKKKIGFLAEINRRCVAQSRAKCGMYFVGNAATFMNSRWFKLVKLMRKEHCVGTDFPLRCTKHETSTFPAATADDINNVISNPKLLCKRMCEDIYACNIHHCKQTCFPRHRHDTCPEIVEDVFPTCLHPVKRKCSQQISNLKCTRTVKFKGSCGHDIQKKCHQKNENVKCPVKPCTKLRKCKHPCGNTCGEDCEMGDCKDCMDIHERKMKMFRKEAEKEAKAIADRIEKKEESEFSIDEISSSGEDSAEYTMVKDQVMKFIQPMHQWFPEIVKIEKVTNLVLQKKFEEAKTKAFGDFICMKFHGTSDEGVKGITKDGFRMPKQDLPFQERGMFGQGIYFATDSSKSAREIYTKGSNKLLLCDVFLGKVKEVRSSDRWWNRKKLKSQKFDSLHAPRNSAVKNDEFVIFNPDQALPRYIIHFKPSNHVVPPSPKHLTHLSFFTKTMKASRQVNFQDPYEMFYNYAESHFRRMSKNQFTIKSIDIVINKELSVAFEKTKRNFKEKDIPNQEILAYHGTDKNNIDSILKANLQVAYSKRQRYGKGNYFSEFPAVSLKYGDGLLLCRILPGKEYVNSDDCNIPPEYNSKKVLLRDLPGTDIANASGEMIIIENSNQILPFFVIHFD